MPLAEETFDKKVSPLRQKIVSKDWSWDQQLVEHFLFCLTMSKWRREKKLLKFSLQVIVTFFCLGTKFQLSQRLFSFNSWQLLFVLFSFRKSIFNIFTLCFCQVNLCESCSIDKFTHLKTMQETISTNINFKKKSSQCVLTWISGFVLLCHSTFFLFFLSLCELLKWLQIIN